MQKTNSHHTAFKKAALVLCATLACSLAGRTAQGAELLVLGPCSEKPVFNTPLPDNSELSVGSMTLTAFAAHGIPYQGDAHSINSIMDTPTDENRMEVVSRSELRVYGWCFSIDGVIPQVTADMVRLMHEDAKVIWFHAYTTLRGMEWGDNCQPTRLLRPEIFCKEYQESAPRVLKAPARAGLADARQEEYLRRSSAVSDLFKIEEELHE